MEPFAGAWNADEPTLDFSRLIAPRTAALTFIPDARATDTRARVASLASGTPSWNPFAGVAAAELADLRRFRR